MKTLALSTAAIAALLFPNIAHAMEGHIDLSAARSDVQTLPDQVTTVDLSGATVFHFTQDLDVQADGRVAHVDADDSDTIGRIGLHLFHREPTFAYGWFITGEDGPSGTGQAYDLGFEGQAYIERANFDAGVSLVKLDNPSDNAFRYRFGITMFPTHDFSFGGSTERLDAGDDRQVTSYDFTLAYGPETSAVSYFAAYRATDDALYSSKDYETVEIGLRWNFGASGSLMARSRSGASFPTSGAFAGEAL